MLGICIIGKILNKDNKLDLVDLDNKILLAAKQTGLKIVKRVYYKFGSRKEATYCFILAQSHLIVHTWPEKNVIAFDLFTCGNKKSAIMAIKEIAKLTKGNIKDMRIIEI